MNFTDHHAYETTVAECPALCFSGETRPSPAYRTLLVVSLFFGSCFLPFPPVSHGFDLGWCLVYSCSRTRLDNLRVRQAARRNASDPGRLSGVVPHTYRLPAGIVFGTGAGGTAAAAASDIHNLHTSTTTGGYVTDIVIVSTVGTNRRRSIDLCRYGEGRGHDA